MRRPGILIVTHGALAPELLAAAERILGRELAGFRALSLDWSEGWPEARLRVEASLAAFPPETGGFLVLTDLHGDTPSRAAAGLGEEGRVEIVTGVNLPMVLTALCHWDDSLEKVTALVKEAGSGSIMQETLQQ